MTRTVVLRGGPLDGHMHEVDDGVHTAYVPYTIGSESELRRLGFPPDASAGAIPVLVYRELARGMPVWKYAGINAAPVREEAE